MTLLKYSANMLALLVGALLLLPALAYAQFDRQLSIGSRGEDVAVLQAYLASNPVIYPEGLVTGYFGPLTEAAVARWQAMTNISGDSAGVVGMQTLVALNTALDTPRAIGGSADTSAPAISTVQITTGTDSAVISWRTDEDANSRVLYGFNWPFMSAVERVATTPFGTSHLVTLTNLMPNTTYFYLLESQDIAGNVAWRGGQTFTTQP